VQRLLPSFNFKTYVHSSNIATRTLSVRRDSPCVGTGVRCRPDDDRFRTELQKLDRVVAADCLEARALRKKSTKTCLALFLRVQLVDPR
jgi:hypothetical protein